jgi:ADP-ribosylglycohydrolase/fructose-1,6-bisphosphatase/inositol monophosphatase family enzyme
MSIYAPALQAAIAAAREAGALLLAEFHREGGPRGDKVTAHADVDTEAEHLLRARLLAACNWGYRGEETGFQVAPDGEEHYWIVDPNDGTAGYLDGWRGSAVSIGVVRAGVPVLGVVFSYNAPDDAGDLIAWAEGCGPLMRNGVPVTSTLTDAKLGPLAVVYGTQHADRNPRDNSRLVVPGRYRGIASVAYRLALTAAGEGVAGISLCRPESESGPVAWDLAGGHALLRGAGGILVDTQGQEIVYSADGWAASRWCFGGSRQAVTRLAGEPWQVVFVPPPLPVSPFELSTLTPGRHIADVKLLSRAQGCWLGQLVGDALGQLVEFNEPDEIRQKYPHGVREMEDGVGTWQTLAGQPTDDSELAMMLARTLVRDGDWQAERVRASYVYWDNSEPFDCGMTTSSALRHGVLTYDSQANGSLMRISPLGIFGAGGRLSDPALIDRARRDSALTHPHPVCQDACAVLVSAIATAIRHDLDAEATFKKAVNTATHKDVNEALYRARFELPEDFLTNQGWVLIALQNAFYQLLHAPNFRAGLQATVEAGGDTDTNAAIAGALLGAVHGREAIPATWRRAVLTCRPLVEAGALRPRPREFWPVDALELAENLVLAGR